MWTVPGVHARPTIIGIIAGLDLLSSHDAGIGSGHSDRRRCRSQQDGKKQGYLYRFHDFDEDGFDERKIYKCFWGMIHEKAKRRRRY
jgi:hypothetical protein